MLSACCISSAGSRAEPSSSSWRRSTAAASVCRWPRTPRRVSNTNRPTPATCCERENNTVNITFDVLTHARCTIYCIYTRASVDFRCLSDLVANNDGNLQGVNGLMRLPHLSPRPRLLEAPKRPLIPHSICRTLRRQGWYCHQTLPDQMSTFQQNKKKTLGTSRSTGNNVKATTCSFDIGKIKNKAFSRKVITCLFLNKLNSNIHKQI